MGRKAVKIELDNLLETLMNKEVKKRQLEKHFYERFLIVLKSSKGCDIKCISSHLGCSRRKVSTWRNRWHEKMKNLDITINENGELLSDKHIVEKVKEVLSDKSRSGCPSGLTEEDITRLRSLACEAPEKYGLPFVKWTHKELSKQAAKLGINISSSWYGILLKKTAYNPIGRNIGFFPK